MSITERFEKGREVMRQVYGEGLLPPGTQAGQSPFMDETVAHLFGEVWSRTGLCVRDRRLLAIGATAMLGRADLIELQVWGALVNGELDEAALQEVLLQLAFYVGWPNATALQRGIQAALTRRAQAQQTG